jgi:hypothetical protein
MTEVLRRMGRGDITVHGFRSTFRDWAASGLLQCMSPVLALNGGSLRCRKSSAIEGAADKK